VKKDPNSIPGNTNTDFSLPRSKILRGKKNFQRIFDKATVISSGTVQFRYRFYNIADEKCLIGFIAPKRLGSAVLRNKIKRRLREIYRLNQSTFEDLFSSAKFGFHGVFIAKSPDSSYHELRSDMISVMQKARKQLLDFIGQKSASSPEET
jgi:ribonuclease P protein component